MVITIERTMVLKTIILIAIWWTSNVISTISSKRALTDVVTDDGKPREIITWLQLTALQSGFGVILALFWSYYVLKKYFTVVGLSLNNERNMILASVANLIGNSATNIAFSMIASSSVQVVKSNEPVFTFFLGLIMMKSNRNGNLLIFISILIICIGSSLFLRGDFSYNSYGLIAAFTSNVAFSFRNILLKKDEEKEPIQKYIIMSLFSFIITLLIVFIRAVMEFDTIYELTEAPILSTIFHFAYNLASINVLQNLSPITHAVLNLSKRSVVVVINVIYFSIPLSNKMAVGASVLLFGLILFSYFSYQKRTKQYNCRKHKLFVCLAILCSITFSSIYYLNFNIHSIKSMRKRKDSQPKYVFTSWLYDQDVPKQIVENMEKVVQRNQQSNFNIYCGSTHCMHAFNSLSSNRVKVKFFRLDGIIKGTPFHEWMKKLPLIKVFAGSNFEELLTHILRICLLWKEGGVYINPSYEYKDFDFHTPTNNTFIVMNDIVTFLDISSIPKHNDFLWQLSKKLTETFSRQEISLQWPVKFDYDNISRTFYKNYYKTFSYDKTPIEQIRIKMNQFKKPVTRKHYATLSYESRAKYGANIGDEVQGFPSMQFLPYIDTFVDRQLLTAPNGYAKNSTKLFFNAWWGNPLFRWPPAKTINPQYLSMHFQDNIKSKLNKSISYLKKQSPIGSRDTATLNWLRKNEVESFLSGCMTLFLKNRYEPKDRTDIIYMVDVHQNYRDLVPPLLQYSFVTHEEGPIRSKRNLLFAAAYKRIDMYARAKLVITQRIHAALPCVALGTPVIFIQSDGLPGEGGAKSKVESGRTSGLTDLFHTVNIFKLKKQKAKSWFNRFNWNNPPPNPRNDLLMRFRATQWSFISQQEELYDSAMKFGLIPPTIVKQTVKANPTLHFYLILDDRTVTENNRLKWSYMRVIEALLFHHGFATVTLFSNLVCQNNFDVLTDVGFNITVKKYDLKEMIDHANIGILKDFDTLKCEHLPLAKLLVLYEHGGIFIEEDVIVTGTLAKLPNYILDTSSTSSILLLKLGKLHDTILSLIKEYVRTYDDQHCQKYVLSALVTPSIKTSQMSSLITPKSQHDIVNCLNQPYQKRTGKYGVQFDFEYLNKELGDKKMKFRTACKHLLNEFCLLCNYQY